MLNIVCLSLTLGLGQSGGSYAPVRPPENQVDPLAPIVIQVRDANAQVRGEVTPIVPGVKTPSLLPGSTTADPNAPVPTEKPKVEEKKKEKPAPPPAEDKGFFMRLLTAYKDEFNKKDDDEPSPPAPYRGQPPPFRSPFPGAEYQGYPWIGPAPDSSVWPLMKAVYGGYFGEEIKESRIKLYGWADVSGNFSTSKNANFPTAYNIVPNRLELDQFILRMERVIDTSQVDHIDWGFRMTGLYGIDYRYTTGAGYFSGQLLNNNKLYGADPLEMYGEVYVPGILEGLVVRAGRYISPPDIEAQLAPDNYLFTHSLLYTYDAYTQTGVLASLRLDKNWVVQAGIHAGNDIAPWDPNATPTLFLGARWVSNDNNDSVYTCVNSLNNAKFKSTHDNFNYVVSTWTHKFNDDIMTATEAYYMWQYHAFVGGTFNNGPLEPYGGGGGPGAPISGNAAAFGMLNYTMFRLNDKQFITVRNEWWNDEKGERTGYATNYSSHTVGLTHQFNSVIQIRPEISYWRSYNTAAFDNGARKNQVMFAWDMIFRF